MWLLRDPASGAVAFRYDRGRSASLPTAVLAGFAGTLQTDGYAAYATALKALAETGAAIERIGCLAHVRRKFSEAIDSDPRAVEAIAILRHIHALEDTWRDRPPDDRLAERRARLTGVFEAFTDWLEVWRERTIPKTPFGRAIGYALRQWPTLAAVLADGRLELDDNGIESCVRPLALGRHDEMGRRGPASESLFAGNHGAAQDTAVLYSLLLSCKAAGVNPRAWLNDTLDRLLEQPVNRIAELLPHAYARARADVVG